MRSIVEAVAAYAGRQPDSFCIADGKRELTYREYWNHIAGYAAYLKERGVGKGDCVVVRNSQNVEFVTCGLAIQLLGAVFVPVEKNVAQQRIHEIYSEVDAKYYIAVKEPEESLSYLSMAEVMDHVAESDANEQHNFEFPQEEQLAEILFTTGTTGKSKGIEILHKNVVAVAENVIDGVEMKKGNVELIPVPLSHSHGLRRYYANMLSGNSVVILDGVIFVKKVFACMEKYGVTAMDLVPAALTGLLKLGADELARFVDRMDYVQLGSAPIPEPDKQKLREVLPKSRLYNFYGTTESGCSSILDFNKYSEKKNCIGRPTCHATFAFLDEDGHEIEATEETPGFLACKGDMNMAGYYRSPELDAEAFRGEYIVTQDMSYMGADGMIYLLGRKGDVIQSGGNKISPSEIEEAALTYEAIADCACIPIDSKMLGQEPKLFYVPEQGMQVSEDDIYRFLREHLEAYKVPKQMEKLDKIPRTYNGKIQRNVLIQREKGE